MKADIHATRNRHAGGDHGGVLLGLNRALMHHVRRRMGEEKGLAALEFALVLPLLLILMLGAMELFQAHMATRKMTRTTNTVADLVTQAEGIVTRADINDYYRAARYIMGSLPADRLAISIHTFRWDATRNEPKLEWHEHLGNYVCREQAPQLTDEQKAAMQDGNDLLVATGCYQYQVTFGSIVLGNTILRMEDDIILRPRQKLQVECSDCS